MSWSDLVREARGVSSGSSPLNENGDIGLVLEIDIVLSVQVQALSPTPRGVRMRLIVDPITIAAAFDAMLMPMPDTNIARPPSLRVCSPTRYSEACIKVAVANPSVRTDGKPLAE